MYIVYYVPGISLKKIRAHFKILYAFLLLYCSNVKKERKGNLYNFREDYIIIIWKKSLKIKYRSRKWKRIKQAGLLFQNFSFKNLDTWTKTVTWILKKKPSLNKVKCEFLRIYQNILKVWNVSITMNFGLVALHASKRWYSGGTTEKESNSKVCLVESWSLIGSGIKVGETAWSIYLLMITKESLLSLLHSLFLTNIWSWSPFACDTVPWNLHCMLCTQRKSGWCITLLSINSTNRPME